MLAVYIADMYEMCMLARSPSRDRDELDYQVNCIIEDHKWCKFSWEEGGLNSDFITLARHHE